MTSSKPQKKEPKSKIRIRLKGYDARVLDRAVRKIVEAVQRTGAAVVGPIPLPTERSLVTVQRATFVKKDAREQFEMRTHKRLIDVIEPSSKTIDSLMSLEMPAGVDIEIKT